MRTTVRTNITRLLQTAEEAQALQNGTGRDTLTSPLRTDTDEARQHYNRQPHTFAPQSTQESYAYSISPRTAFACNSIASSSVSSAPRTRWRTSALSGSSV